ncbi:OmpH family outer membrane protein [Hydrogenophilus thiooxidans]|uniref:OmpH family outer membrane protein n=1 Tax=Hydrogenophilus thiooxidans TaxID=2820326 RepID=UPI001C240AB5|nr:OmpH family outer membrane protein [Hydrogenophilus thiooxidans]
MKRYWQQTILAVAFSLASVSALAQAKIGFVNSERLIKEAAPAVAAQKRLEKEFEPRDRELKRMAQELQQLQQELDSKGASMSENERQRKERTFADLSREFQRKQREFREDLNQRRNEELVQVLDLANQAIKRVAEKRDLDIVFQDAVYASPRIDITDDVIKALENVR